MAPDWRRLIQPHGGGLRQWAARALRKRVRGNGQSAPGGRVVLALFNTLAREGHFWGNMQLSLVAGDLRRMGIDNDLLVLLMRPGEAERNAETVEEFVELMRRWRPAHVVLWANWLPWLPDRLREECGARVMTLDPANPGDVAEGLRQMDPHASTVATIAGASTAREAARVLEKHDPITSFTPSFDYRFLGADHPVPQTLAFVSLLACPYDDPIADNPCFDGLDLPDDTSTQGCSYCNAARPHEPLDDAEKERQLSHQIRYLQRHLPDLAEIAVPFPEDYLVPLAAVMRRAEEYGIQPAVLSGQFNAISLVDRESDLDALLTGAEQTGFEFHANVVGLESFLDSDLRLYNRGDAATVRRALDVLRSVSARHGSFMPSTVGSLILFHPWQTMAGLRANVEAMRREGIAGLFGSLNINDIRFHSGVPLYHLARKDGLLAPVDSGEVQEVPLGGYFAESPWRFSDPDVEAVHRLFAHLDERAPQRLDLLEACVRTVEEGRAPDPAAVAGALDILAAQVARGAIPASGPRAVLHVSARSNTGHLRDLWSGQRFGESLEEALAAARRIDSIMDARVTIAGPEPTLLPWLPDLVAGIKGLGAAEVELLTYGRMLAYPQFVARLAAAGTDRVTVLLHAHTPGEHDAAVRVPGAFDQAITGLRQLARLGSVRTGLAPVVGPENEGRLEGMVGLASDLGASELRLLVQLGNLPLDRVESVAAEADGVVQIAHRSGLAAGYDAELSLMWVGER